MLLEISKRGRNAMELFAVLFLNILIAAGLYVGISAQVTKRIRFHMIRRINEEIRSLVDEVQTETEVQIELLNSKIQAYKILVQRSDALEEKYRSVLRKLEELPERILGEKTEDRKIPVQEFETLPQEKEESFEEPNAPLRTKLNEEEEFKNEYLTLIREKQKEMRSVQEESLEERRQDLTAKAGEGVGRLYRQNIPESQTKETAKPFLDPARKIQAPRNRGEEIAESESNSGTLGILKAFGKKIKESMGWSDTQELLGQPSPTRAPQPMYNPSSTFDISLDGDPFEENRIPVSSDEGGGNLKADFSYQSQEIQRTSRPKTTNHKIPPEENFEKVLGKKMSGYVPQKPDSVKISSEVALQSLGENATKIEKVVFLLKKGYSHEEISEALDLAMGEVDIIERFRLERNRRV